MNCFAKAFAIILTGSLSAFPGGNTKAQSVVSEPVGVSQYEDAIVIYFHAFDVMRAQYPALELRYRLISENGTAGSEQIADLTEQWEKPAFIFRKDETEYAGIIVSAANDTNVIFQRLYLLNETLEPQPSLASLSQNAAIEPGQFLEGSPPTIPQPDLSTLDTVTLGPAGRVVHMDANTFQVKSEINYPLIDSGQNAPLSLQTDDPSDLTKRSIYVPMRSQLYDENGNPGESWHYLCEIPLDPDWLNGTDDVVINLESSDITVHWTQQEFEGRNLLGTGRGGLGQTTGTMARDGNFNMYWSRVPSQIVRFNPTIGDFEIPPVNVKDLMYEDRPTRNEVLGDGSSNLLGHYGDYRMIWSMNHITPKRMVFASVQNRRFNHGFFWAGMWTVPQDHWDDPVAFEAAFHFPVAAWPTAPHDFWDALPEIGGPNYRLWRFRSYGDSLYVDPYPNSVGGPWRVDLNSDGSVATFGSEDSGVFSNFDDALGKPVDATPYNAANKINWSDYGVLVMTRTGLKEALTGTRDNSLSGQIEVNYDAIDHMLQSPAEFAPILDNIGGPSLAPGYMVTPLPGQEGQVLGAAEYGYYLSQLDMTAPTPEEVDKTYLTLDSADPGLELPLKAGLGPYAVQWCDLNGNDWLYLCGYIGITRFQYSANGLPLPRFSMDKFDTRLATAYLDGANAIAGGAIKRYRYLQHGLDDRLFLTGTHTAARGGTAFSGGLMSFHQTELDTQWKLSYMSRCHNTVRLRNRVVRDVDGTPRQEFCHIGSFNPDYAHTIPSEHVPINQDPKIFCYDYPKGGTMRDIMGFSSAPLQGGASLTDIAYSQDRRYLIVMQGGDHLLTFDLHSKQYIDGKRLTFGSGFHATEFNRPSHNLIRAPDDRLFLYAAPSDTATNATFVEVVVSPQGDLSFVPYVELQFASEGDRKETFDSASTYLPDYANNDGSYDLWLGQNYANPDTDCRLVEDFIPPRSFQIERSLNAFSEGISGVPISGLKPGTTPYRADCSDGESVTLTAPANTGGYHFREWVDEAGNSLGTNRTLALVMNQDRSVTAMFEEAPDFTQIDPVTKTISYDEENYTVSVTSNTSWEVTSLPPWLSANPTSGTGNGSITMTAAVNPGTSARNTTIAIGGVSHTLVQRGVPPIGSVSGVSASDKGYSDKIVISWAPLVSAERYHVMRAASTDFLQASEVGQVNASLTRFDDTSATPGTLYYYWVIGWRTLDGAGSEGLSDVGERATDTGGDTPEEAGALIVNGLGAMQNGHLESGDADWYSFNVQPSRFVSVYTTGALDTLGAIYRNSDSSTPVNSVDDDDNSGVGQNFRHDGVLSAGEYLVQITGADGNQSGSYQLHFHLNDSVNYRPDLWAGPTRSQLRGNDYYTVLGSGQTFTVRSTRGAVAYFRVENDGNVEESFRVGAIRNNRKFKFKYYRLNRGRANVTGSVSRGAHQTVSLIPGDLTDFEVKVSPRYRPGTRKRQVMRVRAYSVTTPGRLDVGKSIFIIRR